MKKNRIIALFLLLFLLSGLSGCAENVPASQPEPATSVTLKKYSGSFFDSFDTITQLIGFTETEDEFRSIQEETRLMMLHYHCIFDGYNEYDGIHNLYYVNRNAASGPVQAEPELIELLLWALERQQNMHDTVNVAMGSVLSLWHEYRSEGTAIPPLDRLQERSTHIDPAKVVIDKDAGTIFFTDPLLSLDLGAVAKGYTVEIVATQLLEKKMPHFILSAGGNVRCGENPLDGRNKWAVGIQNPGDGKSPVSSEYLDVVYLKGLSVVTSGDYQRYYDVDGIRYHHIIDPDTLMPGNYMRSVTVVTKDSGYADMLSTAFFLMPYEEGRAFADTLPDVDVCWILMDGSILYTDGMKNLLRSEGATAQ